MKRTIEVGKLPTTSQSIGSEPRCIETLQFIIKNQFEQIEVERLKLYVVAVIEKEIQLYAKEEHSVNQTILNLSLRAYYQLIDQYNLEDKFLKSYLEADGCFNYRNECAFQVLFAALQTDYANEVDSEKLKKQCYESFLNALENNESSIFHIMKALNILLKRHANLKINFELDHFYFCFQTNINGIREEILNLFSFCCKERNQAFEYFQVIVEFWPWTNRTKFYLLSCIFDNHNFTEFAELAELNKKEFFEGIRLSLSYKSLLAASQYLVNSLSKQNNLDILELAVQILTNGSLCELQNIYAQWFGRIKQKIELFHLLKQENEIVAFLFESDVAKDRLQHFRLIVILCMFSNQIFAISKLLFFKISTELITNCFEFQDEAQLLIFRFFVDNISNFAIEDCMQFFLRFIQTHYCIESSQFRNTILGKIPNIINYIAKLYRKVRNQECSFLEESILHFFKELQNLIDNNIGSSVYQPKIFGLKLQEILWKSLYAKDVIKNAKNCCINNNKILGSFLTEMKVFDCKALSKTLLRLIEDPPGFEDAIDLKVNLLKEINGDDVCQSFDLCKAVCKRIDIDECSLSFIYARVFLNIPEKENEIIDLYEEFYNIIEIAIPDFKKDPLNFCKNKNHLYGYLSVLNEIIQRLGLSFNSNYNGLLNMLKDTTDSILEMLNLSNNASKAASFQDMDESLEILVNQSIYIDENHAAARKFLLMTFWFTLKAACDLAANIGYHLISTDSENDDLNIHLDQCLKIVVSTLMKCRHKGAIECAGVCIGKITRTITSSSKPTDAGYCLLFKYLDLLFEEREKISTTRRGAGFSIMLLHIIKNENRTDRPLLKKAMNRIMQKLQTNKENGEVTFKVTNVDCLEALTLHYLCVLVKDTELKDALKKYQNEIILAAIENIDNNEWTICNAALQLFGALIPKIVGQKTATEFEEPLEWETSEVTYDDVLRKLPNTCNYILGYCSNANNFHDTTTRSFILFLGFLAKVENIKKTLSENKSQILNSLKELMWSLLYHQCEKVRKLAAVCFVRLHEFRIELPNILVSISQQIFLIEHENLFQGLIFILTEGLFKMEYESKYTLYQIEHLELLKDIKHNLVTTFVPKNFIPYNLCKLLDLFNYLKLNNNESLKKILSAIKVETSSVGYDAWFEKYQNF